MMGLISLFAFVLIIGLGVVSNKRMNKPVRKGRTYSYSNRVLTIFAGYLALLVICTVIESILPEKKAEDWQKVNHTELLKENENLGKDVMEGKVNRNLLKTEWKFDFTGEKLTISSLNPEVQVVVERKNENDGKLEAFFYQTRSELNNRDISSTIKTPGIQLTDHRLTLLKQPKTKLRFSEFANVFSVTQFTGEARFIHDSEWMIGQSLLYIKIPHNVTVDSENLNIEYTK